MIRWLMRQFSDVSPDPATLDHVPVNMADSPCGREPRPKAIGDGLSHNQKISLALTRRGKPFKCAGDGVPHQIQRGVECIVRIEDVVEAWDAAHLQAAELNRAAPAPNVATINRKPR